MINDGEWCAVNSTEFPVRGFVNNPDTNWKFWNIKKNKKAGGA